MRRTGAEQTRACAFVPWNANPLTPELSPSAPFPRDSPAALLAACRGSMMPECVRCTPRVPGFAVLTTASTCGFVVRRCRCADSCRQLCNQRRCVATYECAQRSLLLSARPIGNSIPVGRLRRLLTVLPNCLDLFNVCPYLDFLICGNCSQTHYNISILIFGNLKISKQSICV